MCRRLSFFLITSLISSIETFQYVKFSRTDSFVLKSSLSRNVMLSKISSRSITNKRKIDLLTHLKLLCRMIVVKNPTKYENFQFTDEQIQDRIVAFKIPLSIPNSDTGMLPLRYAIKSGRRDVIRVLLRLGAQPTATDTMGCILEEVLLSRSPGILYILTDLLEYCDSNDKPLSHLQSNCTPAKYTMRYWLQRCNRHILPKDRMEALSMPRLNALKYRIAGQSFALEQVLSEVASHHVDSELSSKPLVMLFSGPPGHGKSETAKQLASLLEAPFLKIDCRNHANSWEMFGSGVGYVGSESGSQLGNFMELYNNKRAVVLLDEFDFCDPGTWEGFYHVFDEGEYTLKKTPLHDSTSRGSQVTRVLDCSKTIFLLTTNKFDSDIDLFNNLYDIQIEGVSRSSDAIEYLRTKFDEYIRPKLRSFFKGGLTRRIDAVIPFFRFSEEEAHVVTDMYLDKIRAMYIKSPTNQRKIGNFHFDVTDYAIGELSKGYNSHKLDGASSIKREVNSKILKTIHMRWVRKQDEIEGRLENPILMHFNAATGGVQWMPSNDDYTEQFQALPYFLKDAGGRQQTVQGQGETADQPRTRLYSTEQKQGQEKEKEDEEDELLQLLSWDDPYASSAEGSTQGLEALEPLHYEAAGTTGALDMAGLDVTSDTDSVTVDVGFGQAQISDETLHVGRAVGTSHRSAAFAETGALSVDNLTNIGSDCAERLEEEVESRALLTAGVEHPGSTVHLGDTAQASLTEGSELKDPVVASSQAIRRDEAKDGVWAGDETQLNPNLTEKISVTEPKSFAEIVVDEAIRDSDNESAFQEESGVGGLDVSLTVYFLDNASGVTFRGLDVSQSLSSVIIRIGAELSLAANKQEFRCWVPSKGDVDHLLQMGILADGHHHLNASNAALEDSALTGRALTVDVTDSDGTWTFCRYPNLVTVGDILKEQLDATGNVHRVAELLVEMKTGRRWPREAEMTSWRRRLRVGDVIDSMLPRTRFWKEATVANIEVFDASYRKDPMVTVHFLGMSSLNDTMYQLNSPFLQPLYSQSDNWRDVLHPGDEVDVRVTLNNWVGGVVEALSVERNEVTVRVALLTESLTQVVSWSGEDICLRHTHVLRRDAEASIKPLKSSLAMSHSLDRNPDTSLQNNMDEKVISINYHETADMPHASFYQLDPLPDEQRGLNAEKFSLKFSFTNGLQETEVDDVSPNVNFSGIMRGIGDALLESGNLNEFRCWWQSVDPVHIINLVDTNISSPHNSFNDDMDQEIVSEGLWTFCRNPDTLSLGNIGRRNNLKKCSIHVLVEVKEQRNWPRDRVLNYWRRSLQVGSLIDAFRHSSGSWSVAEVVRTQTSQEYQREAMQGYRAEMPRYSSHQDWESRLIQKSSPGPSVYYAEEVSLALSDDTITVKFQGSDEEYRYYASSAFIQPYTMFSQ